MSDRITKRDDQGRPLAMQCDCGATLSFEVHRPCFDREYAWKATRQLSELLGIMPRAGDPLVYARCIIMPKAEASV